MLQRLGTFLEKKQRWFGLPLVALMSVAALAFAIAKPYFLELIELKTLDARFETRGPIVADSRIVIVAVDDHSLETVGRWPWPRDKIGRIIDRLLGEYGARIIGLDMVFSEAQKNPLKESLRMLARSGKPDPEISQWLQQHQDMGNTDARLAKTLRKYRGRICLGYFFYPRGTSPSSLALNRLAQEARLLLPSAMTAEEEDTGTSRRVTRMLALTNNLPAFSKAAGSAGFFNFFPDPDGLVRRVPLVAQLGGYYYPSIDLQTLRMARGWPQLTVRLSHSGVESLHLGQSQIETDAAGRMLINHYGPGHTFRHVSAIDVLQGHVDASIFKDAIVLLGVTAIGVFDSRPSPFDSVFPGVEAHAAVMANMLNHQELRRPAWLQLAELIGVFLLSLGCGWLVLGRGAVVQGASLIAAPVLTALFAFWMFVAYDIWLKETYLILGILLASGPAILIEYVIESRKRAFIHDAFAHYLAPEVVDELARHPETLRLGGSKREITAMFSDIAGFSAISESMHPDELVHFLNLYLTEMSNIVLAYGGTIDKYEGDSIVAFFGAPLDMPDHALRAVQAALMQQQKLKGLRGEWANAGLPEIHARIGVNSGPMVVGNMGTDTYMNYTMMGDDANLASRLEGVNKVYRTSMLMSGHTYFKVRKQIAARFVDRVYVVGKKVPVDIYQPLGEHSRIPDADQQFIDAYEKAWMAMFERQFDTAEAMFSSLLRERPDDGPSLTMLKRCNRFAKKPPPKDWDGIHKLTSK